MAERIDPKGSQRAVIESTAASTSVDAGAGTGKTTTMLLRIERAIDSGAVDPEDVLVLTFANEAAASIRAAVADRLDPETAAAIDIYTYHSFCHRLVREYAYYLGLSPEFAIVTDRDRRRLIGRLLAENEYDFADSSPWRAGTADDLAGAVDRFVQSMSQEDIDPDALTDRLPDIPTVERLNEFTLWLAARAETLSFDNEAFRFFNREEHLEAGREALVDYGKLLTYCRETIADAPADFQAEPVVQDVEAYFGVLQECVTNTIAALDLEDPETKQLPRALFGNEIYGTATGQLEQTPFGRLTHYLAFLRRARHYTDVYADYRRTLEAEGAVDFDQLVRTATGLLADDAVAGEITDRWQQVYCDEFQDTDRTQFELIGQLTDGPDRPDLLAIGDTDQAIYGWRGTDRKGLDRLATESDDHVAHELELNFRSKQEILELTNRCAYGGHGSKTLREDGRTLEAYDEPNPPVRLARIDSDELSLSPAEQVATTVSRLLNGGVNGVPEKSLADIAVIVRTNRQAGAVADELRALQLPYDRSGSAWGERSSGMQTLVSYLRVLVDPAADTHLRRVLIARYRLPEADLKRLQAAPGTLSAALEGADPAAFDAPDRLERAREDLEALREIRGAVPLSRFVTRFREVTRLEWFLTSEDRDAFDRVRRFLDAYDADGAVQTLSPSVVDALERAVDGGSSGRDRGTQSDDCIDVMTVHQAKGLQFDTVLVPYLTDEEWCVEHDYAKRARYRLLSATIDDEIESPLCADLAHETVGEEWRVLHVALTRAENHLFCFGSSYEYAGEPDQLSPATAQACLAEEIEWDVCGERMDLWEALTAAFEDVREAYPETVLDLTDDVASWAGVTPGTITYYTGERSRELDVQEAIETIHRLGRRLRTGTLSAVADAATVVGDTGSVVDTGVGVEGIETDGVGAEGVGVETETRATVESAGRPLNATSVHSTRFPLEALSRAGSSRLPMAIDHSYSAMETHADCRRRHYLDHVVWAVDDPVQPQIQPSRVDIDGATVTGTDTDSSPRIVGTLFHDVAEEAFYREYETEAAWKAAVDRQVTARDQEAHRAATRACVDRYFEATAAGIETPVAAWPMLAAELPVRLTDVEGVDGDVVGVIDSVRRLPTGELVVLDYKATASRIDPAEATQLALYAEACTRLFAEPVSRVGYVYVGELAEPDAEPEPRVSLYTPEQLPSWSAVRRALEAADTPAYEDFTPGDHCQFCPHRSLGCAPSKFRYEHGQPGDDGF